MVVVIEDLDLVGRDQHDGIRWPSLPLDLADEIPIVVARQRGVVVLGREAHRGGRQGHASQGSGQQRPPRQPGNKQTHQEHQPGQAEYQVAHLE